MLACELYAGCKSARDTRELDLHAAVHVNQLICSANAYALVQKITWGSAIKLQLHCEVAQSGISSSEVLHEVLHDRHSADDNADDDDDDDEDTDDGDGDGDDVHENGKDDLTPMMSTRMKYDDMHTWISTMMLR